MDSKGKLKNLIIATQSWTLTASGSSALIAISYVFYLYKIGAVAEFNWLLGLIALFVAIILQIFVNLINGKKDSKYFIGELLVYVAYGLLIPLGVSFVMTSEIILRMLIVSIPVGLLIVAVVYANNTRDIKKDKDANIKTEAVRLGLEGAQVTYQTLLFAAYLLIAILVSVELLHPITFLTLLSFPIANRNIKKMKMAQHNDNSHIQQLDRQTAKLLILFVVFYSAANFIAPFI